jgi:tetratricopeptide (TPR) repeat protein
MKSFIVTILLLFTFLAVFAGDEQSLIIKANKAYAAGGYTEAVDMYKQVVAMGLESPELYYNLGNACFKMNDLAGAILWYERAKQLDPANEDIDFNLKVANNKIADKIEPLPELFYKRWYKALVALFPVDTWAWMGIVLFLTALGAGVLYLVSRVLILRKLGFWTALVVMFLALLSIIFSWSGSSISRSSAEAIVFAPTITVKSSPDEKSTDLFVIHEGSKVQLIDRIGAWYEIRIANGSVGWLPVTALEKI